ncbi:MAG: 30S ribosomal protein S4 [Thermoplasmatales archaeon]|nr:30S ribosomal protein S4 [Thermoplasmatales archaeon]
MGKPKFSRKKYETPSHPWQADRIKEENELIEKYGLKNKREIWKAKTRLRKYRGQARELLAKVRTEYVQSKKESDQLLMHLNRMNILPINSTLDDVLALETESILSRRLQTLTYLKGLANTPDQARQIISHGHIGISEKRVTVPSYMVTKDEEGEIGYTSDSPLNDVMHPARPRADFKSVPGKEETKPKEPKEEVKEEPPKKEEKPSEEKPEEKPTEDKKTEEAPKEDKPSDEPEKKEEASPTESTTEEKSKKQPKEETVGEENKQSEKSNEDKKEGD